MRTRRILIAGLAILVVVGALVAWRATGNTTRFAQAVHLAPGGTQRVTWTDWARLRDLLKEGRVPEGDDVARFLDEGFEADLTATSALLSSMDWLSEVGLSPATLDWEMLAQSSDGAALVLHAARDLDFDQLEAQLAQSGYARKDPEADSWLGGGEVASTLGITPELQNLILLPDDRLVVASDRAAYAAQVAEVARGERDHLSGLDHLIASAGTPASAVLLAGSYACEHLAMGQADEADQAEGAELIAQAGDVGPLDGYLVAAQTARRGRILLGSSSSDRAEREAKARAALAVGPAPGQGGSYADRFDLVEASTQDRVVVLDVRLVPGAYALSDLTSGPVLFATC